MYTIIMNNNKTLTASKRVVLYEGDNLADKIRFLFPQEYNGIDLSECIVRLNYRDLVGEEQSELLEKDDELYKDRLSYKYPVDSKFTRFYGDILYYISFSIMKDEIESEDVLFHTESHTITISPRSDSIAPEEVIPEDSASKILKEVYDLEDRLIELEENGVGGEKNAVKYTEQKLSEEQKKQARKNIGVMSQDDILTIINDIAKYLEEDFEVVNESINNVSDKVTLISNQMISFEVEEILELPDVSMTVNDDGNGNVTVDTYGIDVIDDNGNISITSEYMTISDDGKCNITVEV